MFAPLRAEDFPDTSEDLISALNDRLLALGDAVDGGLSLKDNFYADVVNIKASHATPVNVRTRVKNPKSAVLLSCNGGIVFGTPIISPRVDGTSDVTIWFTDVDAADVDVSLLMLPDGQQSDRTPNLAIPGALLGTPSVNTVNLYDDAVHTAKMQDLAVQTAKLADLAVTTGKLINGAVDTSKLADLAVSTAKLADTSVVTGKLADLGVTLAKMAALSVDTSKLVDSAVTTVKLNDASVASAKLIDASVITAKLADLGVTGAKIDNVTISGGKLIAHTISANEIAALTITAAEIAAATITAAKIAANTITAGQIAAGTITATEIAALTITAAQIAASTITAAKIAANTITASQIAALTITAAEIAANTITAAKIASHTITAAEIAALTITAAEIAANTITSGKIGANEIKTANLDALAVTTAKLAALAVTTAKIDAASITVDKLIANEIIAGKISKGQFNTMNLWPNPTSEEAPPASYVAPVTADPEFEFRYNAGAGAYAGSYVRRFIGIAGDPSISFGLQVPAAQGESYRWSSRFKWITSGAGANASIALSFYDAALGTTGSTSVAIPTTDTTWTEHALSLVAPPGTVWAAFLFGFATPSGVGTGELHIDAISATKQVASTDLADQEAWTGPTYANSWVNFGGTSMTGGYMKDSLGLVHLRGAIKSGTIGLSAFTLPTGYRPTKIVRFAVASNGAYGEVDIDSAGVVTPVVGTNVLIVMDGITFDTR